MPNIKITLNDGTTKTVRFDEGFTDADIEEVASQLNSNIGAAKKGLDLTPSGLVKKAGVAIATPIVAAKEGVGLKDAYDIGKRRNEEYEKRMEQEHPFLNKVNKLQDFAVDTAVYSKLPMLRGGGVARGVGNAVIQGGVPGLLEGAKEGQALEGAAAGTGVAGVINMLPGAGRYISKGLANPNFQRNFGKLEELLTSVPSEMSERALQKELTGNSIFKGKFDTRNINEAYNEAGQRAIAGMKNAEYQANKQIGNALNSLPADSINAPQLLVDITKDIDSLSRGGRINPALEEKGDDILNVLSELGNKNNKTVDFHHIKDNLQTKLKNQYGKESGTGINALKGISAKVRQVLNDVSPEYAQANANREMLHDIKDSLGGMNKKTIASKLRNVEGDANVRAGYSQAAEELEKLVAPEYKFLDEVKDLRAREALEQWFPGQGGGFGSGQGAGNLVRNAFGLGSVPTAAITLQNPWLLLGTTAISPKLGAKAAIQNLGRLNKASESMQKLLPEEVRKILTPMSIQGVYNE